MTRLKDKIIKEHKDNVLKLKEDSIKNLYSKVLEITNGNQSLAADLLDINRNTLHRRITELGINHKQFHNTDK